MPRLSSEVEASTIALLQKAYEEFNARNIDAVLSTMKADVEWPNGMEGGIVHGHDEVRSYWTRQWGVIDPHVEPLKFASEDSGRVVVSVHQIVRDLAGQVLFDRIVQHVYTLEDGLVRSMQIRE